MKFSLSLAQYYSDLDFLSLGRNEIVERIGAQLGAIEEVVDVGSRYQGIVVARVVTCEKHPDADKLSICQIDDGGAVSDVDRDSAGLVQVVCGAPNVREGLMVAWIPPGSAVPQSHETESEPFVLGARKLRGEVSNGMLASARELLLSDDHQGILELNSDVVGRELVAGEAFAPLFSLDDLVIDCENKMFTHRPDCFGNIGVARELAGIFNMPYESPEWYAQLPDIPEPLGSNNYELDVSVPDDSGVSRFMAVVMDDVQMGQSPLWMQSFLKRVGIKPINNVVDITNYVMHFLGQPMHAFDYDKMLAVAGANDNQQLSFGPRLAQKDESIKLLGDKKATLQESDIVISAANTAVALGGVMGGVDTEVDATTSRILIECATFDMYAIRRTSMRHGLFTDAVTRYNKGQSPLQNDRAVWYAMKLLRGYAGAQRASDVYDIANFNIDADNRTRVELSSSFINSRLGSRLSGAEIKKLLENVEFVVAVDDLKKSEDPEQDAQLIVTAPFWRMDIALKEDIVEEVGRLHGYDQLPVSLPKRSSRPAAQNDKRLYKQQIRDLMTQRGANEVLTYSFVHGKLMQHTGIDPDQWAYHLRNALSPDLQYYRTALVPSLLAKVHTNLKAGAGTENNQFALYELGSVHVKDHMSEQEPELPKQMSRMSAVFAADEKTATARHEGSAYFHAKAYVDALTHGQAVYAPLESAEYPITAAYQIGRAATVTVDGQVLGVVGEFHTKARSGFKLPDFCAGFELDTELLQQHMQRKTYKPLSAFPSSQQSITLKVPAAHSWKHVYDFIHAELAVAAAEDQYQYSLDTADIYRPDDSDLISYTFTIKLTHPHKTLKTVEVTTLLEKIATQALSALDAVSE